MSGFLREEDLCSTIKKEIVPLIRHEDFAKMYKEGGRPPLSPKLLLMVTVFQFLEGCTTALLCCPFKTSRFMDDPVKKLRLLLKFAMRVLSQLLSSKIFGMWRNED